MPRTAKPKVCSLSKLWLLKYATKNNIKCYPREKGRILESHEGTIRMLPTGENVVWCCGKRLGRHRKAGGRRKMKRWDWRRAYRAHASYNPRRRRR